MPNLVHDLIASRAGQPQIVLPVGMLTRGTISVRAEIGVFVPFRQIPRQRLAAKMFQPPVRFSKTPLFP
jgi:hypothetical protein